MNPSKLKNYIIQGKIGSGNFAEVRKVIEKSSKGVFAMKILSNKLIKDQPKIYELMLSEIKILKECNNENIVRFYEHFEENDNQYIVMEYCDGGDLEEHLESQPKERISEPLAISYLKQLLNGFKELHKNKAMHRDFKLENILMNDGILKIADLGFSKQGAEMAKTTLGTRGFMAPEIMKYQDYSNKVDIWSLGVCLYRMLFGDLPFKGNNPYDLLQKIDKNKINFDVEDVEISENLKDLIQKMLTPDPKKRIDWVDIYNHDVLNSSIKKSKENEKFGSFMKVMSKNDLKNEHQNLIFMKNKEYYESKQEIKEIKEENTENNDHLVSDNEEVSIIICKELSKLTEKDKIGEFVMHEYHKKDKEDSKQQEPLERSNGFNKKTRKIKENEQKLSEELENNEQSIEKSNGSKKKKGNKIKEIEQKVELSKELEKNELSLEKSNGLKNKTSKIKIKEINQEIVKEEQDSNEEFIEKNHGLKKKTRKIKEIERNKEQESNEQYIEKTKEFKNKTRKIKIKEVEQEIGKEDQDSNEQSLENTHGLKKKTRKIKEIEQQLNNEQETNEQYIEKTNEFKNKTRKIKIKEVQQEIGKEEQDSNEQSIEKIRGLKKKTRKIKEIEQELNKEPETNEQYIEKTNDFKNKTSKINIKEIQQEIGKEEPDFTEQSIEKTHGFKNKRSKITENKEKNENLATSSSYENQLKYDHLLKEKKEVFKRLENNYLYYRNILSFHLKIFEENCKLFHDEDFVNFQILIASKIMELSKYYFHVLTDKINIFKAKKYFEDFTRSDFYESMIDIVKEELNIYEMFFEGFLNDVSNYIFNENSFYDEEKHEFDKDKLESSYKEKMTDILTNNRFSTNEKEKLINLIKIIDIYEFKEIFAFNDEVDGGYDFDFYLEHLNFQDIIALKNHFNEKSMNWMENIFN